MKLRLSCKMTRLDQKPPCSAIRNHSFEAGFETASCPEDDYGADFTGRLEALVRASQESCYRCGIVMNVFHCSASALLGTKL